jgi:hypothetical protein
MIMNEVVLVSSLKEPGTKKESNELFNPFWTNFYSDEEKGVLMEFYEM